MKKVETYVQDDTAYLRKHMGEALEQLESEPGKVEGCRDQDRRQETAGQDLPK